MLADDGGEDNDEDNDVDHNEDNDGNDNVPWSGDSLSKLSLSNQTLHDPNL